MKKLFAFLIVCAFLDYSTTTAQCFGVNTAGTAMHCTLTVSSSFTFTGATVSVNQAFKDAILPPGVMWQYGGSSAPAGFLLCDGSAVSRTTYATLFAILSTTYGVGDGSTTFNLPDLRQRFPLGKAASGTGNTLGGTGGTIDHLHTVNPPSTTTGSPSATVQATILAGGAASTTHTHDVDISQFNSGTENPPFLVVNYIIKY